MDPTIVYALIPISAIVGGITVGIVGITTRARTQQLRIRERIAMVEKGLIPSDGGSQELDRDVILSGGAGAKAGRHRHVGIILIGVGLGLMLLIGVTDNSWRDAVGVGGLLILIGAAFALNAYLDTRARQGVSSPPPPTSSLPPSA